MTEPAGREEVRRVCPAHPYLLGQVEEIKSSVDRGFENLSEQMERGFVRVHERIDDHLVQHAARAGNGKVAKADSSSRLPAGLESARKWMTFALTAGATVAGLGTILYWFYLACERGLFR